MRKLFKNASLIWLIFAISCAVANWGNELTKNPVLVSIILFASAIVYAITAAFDD